MNRTDRLYAIVEELRRSAPRARRAAQLAEHFEVSTRTVERDIAALQQSGVPIWSTPGPSGGYTVDPGHTMPPVTFTPGEATAIAVALTVSGTIPFGDDARAALAKVVGAMSADGRDRASALTKRIRLLERGAVLHRGPVLRAVEQAVVDQRVLALDYIDRHQIRTDGRLVEPYGLAGSDRGWYLVGWCRKRGGGRSFRLDRIVSARVTAEAAPLRSFEEVLKRDDTPDFRPIAVIE